MVAWLDRGARLAQERLDAVDAKIREARDRSVPRAAAHAGESKPVLVPGAPVAAVPETRAGEAPRRFSEKGIAKLVEFLATIDPVEPAPPTIHVNVPAPEVKIHVDGALVHVPEQAVPRIDVHVDLGPMVERLAEALAAAAVLAAERVTLAVADGFRQMVFPSPRVEVTVPVPEVRVDAPVFPRPIVQPVDFGPAALRIAAELAAALEKMGAQRMRLKIVCDRQTGQISEVVKETA